MVDIPKDIVCSISVVISFFLLGSLIQGNEQYYQRQLYGSPLTDYYGSSYCVKFVLDAVVFLIWGMFVSTPYIIVGMLALLLVMQLYLIVMEIVRPDKRA